MDTCRICLGTDHQERLISPCNCRGSSAFIHQECLEQYLEYFPDGICRVCQVRMQLAEAPEIGLGVVALFFTIIVLNNAIIPGAVKLAILAGFVVMLRELGSHGLMNARLLSMMLGMSLLLLTAQHDALVLVIINVSLLLVGTLMTLLQYVNVEGLLACVVAGVCYVYSVFLTLRILFDTDVWTNIVFMNFLCMGWYMWNSLRQPIMPPVRH